MAVWERTPEGLRLRVRVQPRSSRTRVCGVLGEAVKVQVTAAPVEGAANEALLGALAKWLSVPRRTVTLVHGQTARDKVVQIAARSPADMAARIEALLASL